MNDKELLVEIFPFGVVFNEHLVVEGFGQSIFKLTGDIKGKILPDIFDVRRPFLERLTFEEILNHSQEVFYLTHVKTQLVFRGQFRVSADRQHLIWIASLWVMDVEQLKTYKLTIADFSHFDPTFDFLHALKQAEIHKNELSDLVSKINLQSLAIKKSNDELLDTKTKLESIFNEMSDVVYSIKIPEWEVLFVTPSVKTVFGYTMDEFARDFLLWKKVMTLNDKDVTGRILAALREGGRFSVEYKIKSKSGEFKWIKNQGKYIFDTNNQAIRIDGVVIDITSEYIARENLSQEIRLQEALIDIASTYINLDPSDVESVINHSLQKMGLFVSSDRAYIFDYDFENGTTSNTYEWCNDGITAEIQNLQEVPIAFFPQFVEKHKIGEAFYIPDVNALEDDGEGGLRSILQPQGIKSLITIPMLDGKELVGFVGFDSVKHHYEYSEKEKRLLFLFGQMLINIRNRQKWDNQLRLQEEKYRNIIANMYLGLLEVDLNDHIIYANQTFCEMAGYDLQDLKGQPAAELFVKEQQRSVIYEKNQDRLQNKSDSYEIEVKNKKGEKRWWFVSGAPNYNDKGQLIGSIGIHLDITEQKRLESELENAKSFAEAAAKAKELFLANMSHEIRTPLNVIIGMIRQLSKTDLSKDQHFYVKQSESSARHLLTILNNILDIAKIDSGDMEIMSNFFSPSALLYNVHSIMYSQAADKDLEFKIIVSPALSPVLIGDETRIRQILLNLIGNAIKFTQKGGILLNAEVVGSSPDTQTILFEVTDTGIGMSEDFVSRIFDKFSQEHNASNRKYEGTGLGMAISHDLVRLMGGSMKVNSRKSGGTSVSFELSLPIGSRDALKTTSKLVNEGLCKGKKALLVEDNEMNRFIAVQSLDYLGFETTEAENGKLATELLRQNSFDIILMDIQMPVMDGVEATTYIREVLKLKTPIIALTANAFKHDIDLYLQKGMNDFITKPYDEQDFFRKIEHVLHLSELLSEDPENKTEEFIFDEQPGEPLYNLTSLRQMSRGDDRFVDKMVQLFVNLAKQNIEIINAGITSEDFESIRKTAHKIKPSIDQMGIVSLGEIVRKIEKYDFDKGSKSEFVALTLKIVEVLDKVVLELEK